MPSFLVNYGGPSPQISSMSSGFGKTIQACEKFYHSKVTSVSFSRQGLNLTYYQVGIHRMLKVELPEQVINASKSKIQSDEKLDALETVQLYTNARKAAYRFNSKDYKLTQNNCVTAVGHTFNSIDPSILGGDKQVVPNFLDSKIAKETDLDKRVHQCIGGTDANYTQYGKDDTHQIWESVMSTVGNSSLSTFDIDETETANMSQQTISTIWNSDAMNPKANTLTSQQEPKTSITSSTIKDKLNQIKSNEAVEQVTSSISPTKQ